MALNLRTIGFFSKPSGSCGNSFVSTGVWLILVGVFSEGKGVATSSLVGWGLCTKTKIRKYFFVILTWYITSLTLPHMFEVAQAHKRMATGGIQKCHASTTYAVDGCLMRSEICLESWWELRTIMLCSVAGCWGMLMLMAPTLTTAALFVFNPRWALYRAWDLAILHFTTVLTEKEIGFICMSFKTVTVLC